MHRSQLDPLYHDESASRYVLVSKRSGEVRAAVRAGRDSAANRRRTVGGSITRFASVTRRVGGVAAARCERGTSRRNGAAPCADPIRQGFPLDGYDYS